MVSRYLAEHQMNSSLWQRQPRELISWFFPSSCKTLRVCSITQVVSDSLQPYDYSPPGSSVHRILHARILDWVAMAYSRDSFRTHNGTHVSWASPALAAGKPSCKTLFTAKMNWLQSWVWSSAAFWGLHDLAASWWSGTLTGYLILARPLLTRWPTCPLIFSSYQSCNPSPSFHFGAQTS